MITFSSLGNYGRLGNQLFQISALMGYSKKHDIPWAVPKTWEYLKNWEAPTHSTRHGTDFKHYLETEFEYKEIPYADDLDVGGYFQSEKYFEHCKKDIAKMFIIPNNVNVPEDFKQVTQEAENKDFIAIHIRRGDYVTGPKYYVILPPEYYKEAVNTIYCKIGKSLDYIKSNIKILCFSDDINWCKQNLCNHIKIDYYSENHSPIEDLFLMSMCDHFVIANSSFSWWGAWLGEFTKLGCNEPCYIVTPENKYGWFLPLAQKNTKDLIPERWIKL